MLLSMRVFCRAAKALPTLWPETFTSSAVQWKLIRNVVSRGNLEISCISCDFHERQTKNLLGTNHLMYSEPGDYVRAVVRLKSRRPHGFHVDVVVSQKQPSAGARPGKPGPHPGLQKKINFSTFSKRNLTSFLWVVSITTSYLLGFCWILKH